ncbi:hypothetical protein H6G45_00700 [Synechocystis sp. FACHB-383]|uniref:hypothetical protein n=1 Tax=Synechocystis sp. FACHB-383 TaxID=2692864 RepID=UPI001682C4F5|nr:hypothetical protein [Synechocystis sp. FACHB-383]MBD2652032.1 hypothetical protein [Synechocystis sp. FACHB-383]
MEPVEVVALIAVGKEEGLTSVALGDRLGIHERTVQKWGKKLGNTPPEYRPKGSQEAIVVPPWEFRNGLWYPVNEEN